MEGGEPMRFTFLTDSKGFHRPADYSFCEAGVKDIEFQRDR